MKKSISFGIGIFILASIYALSIANFYSESNPFTIEFIGGDTQEYVLHIPLYAQISSLNLTLRTVPNLLYINNSMDNFSLVTINNTELYIKNVSTGILFEGNGTVAGNDYLYNGGWNITSNDDAILTRVYRNSRPDYGSDCDSAYIYNETWGLLGNAKYGNGIEENGADINVSMELGHIYYIVSKNSTGEQCWPRYTDKNYPPPRNFTRFNITHFMRDNITEDSNYFYGISSIMTYKPGDYNLSVNASFSIAPINTALIGECACTACTLSGLYCDFSMYFYSNIPQALYVALEEIDLYSNITINIYDRISGSLITNEVAVSISGYTNYTTTTGHINIGNFSGDPGPYTLVAASEGYTPQQQDFLLTDYDSTQVNIYMVNATGENTGTLIVEVFDEFYNYLANANTKLLEYSPALNSFVEVSQCYTSSDGICIFSVELGTKFYIVTATYTDGNRVLYGQSSETGQIVYLDQTVFSIHLTTSEVYTLPDIYNLVIVPSNTELVGNRSYLTATFNDNTNTNHTVCISYHTGERLNEIEQANTCVNGSSGIVNFAGGYLLDRDYTYIARIYILNPDNSRTIYKAYIYEAVAGTLKTTFGIFLSHLIFALVLALLALSWYLKNMAIFGYSIMGFSPMALYFDSSLMGGVTMTFIILLGIIVLYSASKKQTVG